MADRRRPLPGGTPRDPPLKNDRAGNMAQALSEEDYKIQELDREQRAERARYPGRALPNLNDLYQKWTHDPAFQREAKARAPYSVNQVIDIPPTPDDPVDQRRKALLSQMKDK